MAANDQEEILKRINTQLEKGLQLTDKINKNRPKRLSTRLGATFEEELRLKRLISNEE